jgi:hypothetical protein
MTALTWDAAVDRKWETGVDKGVLYLPNGSGIYDTGYAWNGLTTVTESPTGAEVTKTYADNIIYGALISVEEFEGTIECYTTPDEFAACDGFIIEDGVYIGQQPRATFGFAYRTRVGNAITPELGYKLHLVYGALATPSEKAYATVNDSPEAATFSYDFTTTPVPVTGKKPTSILVIPSTDVDPDDLLELETILYGSVGVDPRLPPPDEVLAIFSGALTTTALPTAPSYDSGTDIVTIPTVTGVIYYTDEDGDLAAGAFGPITANTLIQARPASGYKFPTPVQDEWLIVFA